MNNIKYVEYFFFNMCTRSPEKFNLESKSPIKNRSSGEAYTACQGDVKCDCTIDR